MSFILLPGGRRQSLYNETRGWKTKKQRGPSLAAMALRLASTWVLTFGLLAKEYNLILSHKELH